MSTPPGFPCGPAPKRFSFLNPHLAAPSGSPRLFSPAHRDFSSTHSQASLTQQHSYTSPADIWAAYLTTPSPFQPWSLRTTAMDAGGLQILSPVAPPDSHFSRPNLHKPPSMVYNPQILQSTQHYQHPVPSSQAHQTASLATPGFITGTHLSNFENGSQLQGGFYANDSFGSNGSGGRDDSFGDNRNRSPQRQADDSQDSTGGGGNGNGGEREAEKDKAKKANPLIDLLESETAYVSEISKVIKKVAAAWSRSNFPPPQLDAMFRNIEAVYRVNRGFLKALKEIGPNPSSPKALGDLLMRWIDDLEPPYARFCESYMSDFDSWSAVQDNPKLGGFLAEISTTLNPDGTPVVFSDKKRDPNVAWTLDGLFALPHIRLKYYKKLYARLLKSTQAGRSDHRLLVGANEKLDQLLEKSKQRLAISVLDEVGEQGSQDSYTTEGNTTAETSPRARVSSSTSASEGRGSLSPQIQPLFSSKVSGSVTSVSNGADSQDHGRAPTPSGISRPSFSPQQHHQQPAQQQSRGPSPSPASPTRPTLSHKNSAALGTLDQVSSSRNSAASQKSKADDSLSQFALEMEQRLDTSQTLDIFTMKPKKCQLQINTPNIPFKRMLRKSADVVIHFTPSSGGPEISIKRAHIFLLTDLFLVCERMTPSERAERSKNGVGPDMWLLYPPLAGKHLRVSDIGAQGNTFCVMILKKEKLMIHTESKEAKDTWMNAFDECQTFAGSLGLKVKTANNSIVSPISGGLQSSTSVLSPEISVTPSTQDSGISHAIPNGDISFAVSPTGSGLSHHGSLSSAASFPKALSGPRTPQAMGSPDLRIPGPASPRSPLVPVFNGPGPGPAGMGRPFPPSPGGPVRPAIMSPNGFRSPESSPGFGPTRLGAGHPGGGMVRPPFMQDPYMPTGMTGQGAPSGISPRNASSPIPGSGPPGNGMPPRPTFPPQHLGAPWSSSGYKPPHDPTRRPSAPNLRAAAQTSANGRLSDDTPNGSFVRTRSVSSTTSTAPKLPSEMLKEGRHKGESGNDVSPPPSPTMHRQEPKRSTVSAQMRCKLFLNQGHAQWKSLGNARLKLYHVLPDDVNQLVVENDRKTLISTIVLSDGVERVGKVGVAVELSDQGNRTGIVYMLQLRSEESAGGLFGQLIEGSDRTTLSAR